MAVETFGGSVLTNMMHFSCRPPNL